MSVSWGTQYAKLKTNLRLAVNRLRLLQKKKTEMAQKARTEIADFLNTDKEDRARIKVETIIREDFVVEAYELLEMLCELLLARFGLIQQMKDLDDGIAEAVASILWVAPRISHEIAEFKVINDQLQQKYGKQFAEAARMNQLPEPSRVSTKLIQKLAVSAPSKILVEKYLVEIARSAGIPFTPDPKVMRDDDDEIASAERNLVNFMNEEQIGWNVTPKNNNDGGHGNFGPSGGAGSGTGGGGGMKDFNYPAPIYEAPKAPPSEASFGSGMYPKPNIAPVDYQASNLPSYKDTQINYGVPHNLVPGSANAPHPPSNEIDHIYEVPPGEEGDTLPKFPEPPTTLFPAHHSSNSHHSNSNSKPSDKKPGDDMDFDELARRFDELKKKI